MNGKYLYSVTDNQDEIIALTFADSLDEAKDKIVAATHLTYSDINSGNVTIEKSDIMFI